MHSLKLFALYRDEYLLLAWNIVRVVTFPQFFLNHWWRSNFEIPHKMWWSSHLITILPFDACHSLDDFDGTQCNLSVGNVRGSVDLVISQLHSSQCLEWNVGPPKVFTNSSPALPPFGGAIAVLRKTGGCWSARNILSSKAFLVWCWTKT